MHRKIALSPRKLVKRKIRRLKHDAESTAQRGVEEGGGATAFFVVVVVVFLFILCLLRLIVRYGQLIF